MLIINSTAGGNRPNYLNLQAFETYKMEIILVLQYYINRPISFINLIE